MIKSLFKKTTRSDFNLTTGRILLLLSPFVIVGLRYAFPAGYLLTNISDILTGVIIAYSVIVLVLSYLNPAVRKHIYWLVLIGFCIYGGYSLYHLHIFQFSNVMRTGFLVFILLTPWYLANRTHLLLYFLLFFSLLVLVYFVTPGVESSGTTMISRYVVATTVLYFLIGSRIAMVDKLIEQDLHHQRMIDNLNEGFLQLNEKGVVQTVNKKICEMLGYEADELLNRFSVNSLISEEDRNMIYQKLDDRTVGKKDRYEIRLVKKDGGIIWVQVSASPTLNGKGEVIGSNSVLVDITERKEAELERDNFSQTLLYTHRELALKNAELEQFAEMASSDLREPIDEISKSIKIIEGLLKESDPLLNEYIDSLTKNSRQMRDLLDALLIYSASSVKFMSRQEIDLNQTIEEVKESLKTHISLNRVALKYEPLPAIRADRVQMMRLFRNLIENGIKYRGEQAPVIQISCNINPEKQEYVFAVEDNGMGIKREDYEKVFMIFRKNAEPDTSGVGMGLAISKKIVSNHKGRLWFTSNVGKGSTFYFSIPLEESEYGENAEEEQVTNDKVLSE